MAVDQHGRRRGNGRRLGIDDRMAGRFDQLGGQSQPPEMPATHWAARRTSRAVLALGADAGDAQQFAQIVFEIRGVRGQILVERGHWIQLAPGAIDDSSWEAWRAK